MRHEGVVYIAGIGNVQDSQGVSASEMTYIVSSGALNSTHSLIRPKKRKVNYNFQRHNIALLRWKCRQTIINQSTQCRVCVGTRRRYIVIGLCPRHFSLLAKLHFPSTDALEGRLLVLKHYFYAFLVMKMINCMQLMLLFSICSCFGFTDIYILLSVIYRTASYSLAIWCVF